MKASRFINSGACDGTTNMAIDEALLYTFQEKISKPVFRIYRWKKHALSFGCSQDPCALFNLAHCEKENIPLLRRPTGGGIIYHDDELTYSITLADSDLDKPGNVKETLKQITSFLIGAYKSLGIDACFACESNQKMTPPNTIADFCFSRKEEYDILIKGKKIGGNAQKRKKHLILQHGSIPFSFSKEKIARFLKNPQLLENLNITSINEIADIKISFETLSDVLKNAFCEHFSTTLEKSELNKEEKTLAEQLKREKYSNSNWIMYRQ